MGSASDHPGFGLVNSVTEDLDLLSIFLLEYFSPALVLGVILYLVWPLCYQMFPSLYYMKHKS